MKHKFLFLCMMSVLIQPLFAAHGVTELRTLGLDAPIGIESNPTFSWKITSNERCVIQSAYEITVTGSDGNVMWNSGKVESSNAKSWAIDTRPEVGYAFNENWAAGARFS